MSHNTPRQSFGAARLQAASALVTAALLLTACGGGGADEGMGSLSSESEIKASTAASAAAALASEAGLDYKSSMPKATMDEPASASEDESEAGKENGKREDTTAGQAARP